MLRKWRRETGMLVNTISSDEDRSVLKKRLRK